MDIFMQEAIDEALEGLSEGKVPIGAVLVENGKIIGRGRNRRVQQQDRLMHAEIGCLCHARLTGGYHNTTLYSTHMPCYQCAGTVVQFGIKKVVVVRRKVLLLPGTSWRNTYTRTESSGMSPSLR
jgi:cytosine deaminase